MGRLSNFLKFVKPRLSIVIALVALVVGLFYSFFPFAPDMTLQKFSLKAGKGEPTPFQIPDTFIARGPAKSAYQIRLKNPYFTYVIVEFKHPELIPWEEFEYRKVGSNRNNKTQHPDLFKMSLKISSSANFDAKKSFEGQLNSFYATGITRFGLTHYRAKTDGYSLKDIKWDSYLNQDRYQLLDPNGTTYRIKCVNEEFGERVHRGGNYLCTAITDFNKDIVLTYRFSTKLLKNWREIARGVRALTRHFIQRSEITSQKME